MEKDGECNWRCGVGEDLSLGTSDTLGGRGDLNVPQERGWGDWWRGSFYLNEAAHDFRVCATFGNTSGTNYL